MTHSIFALDIVGWEIPRFLQENTSRVLPDANPHIGKKKLVEPKVHPASRGTWFGSIPFVW